MGDADRGPEVTDGEILAVFAGADERPLQTRRAADELTLSTERLRDRLDDLYERSLLDREEATAEVPGDAEAWALTADGREAATSDERIETEIEAQASKDAGAETPPHAEETPETPPPDPQESPGAAPPHEPMPDAIEAFDPPGDAAERDRRRGALHEAYLYLRKRGPASREDIVEDVFTEIPAGYDNPGEGWWDEVVAPGLDRLPDVERTDDGRWRFTGEGGTDTPEGGGGD